MLAQYVRTQIRNIENYVRSNVNAIKEQNVRKKKAHTQRDTHLQRASKVNKMYDNVHIK